MITDLGVIGSAQPDPAPEPRPRPWQRPGLRRRVLIGSAVVWAVALTAFVLLRGGGAPETPRAATPAPSPSASAGPLTTGEVYEQLLPSMVRIEAGSAIGTGVIVNADGTILTAQHVIAGGSRITVVYADGARTTAQIAQQDAARDIATLRPAKLPETVVPAALGGGAQVGDEVVAIGNPLGLTFSTTGGVVSGLDRAARGQRGANMSGLIQFDAAVNPGSSGGPLLNDQAQVVGIVVSLANPTDAGTFIGIGFAVPIGAALGGSGDGEGRAPPL